MSLSVAYEIDLFHSILKRRKLIRALENRVTYIPSALRLVEAGHGCVESVAEDY